MNPGRTHLLELLRVFRVTLAVFVGFGVAAWIEREAVAAWLAGMGGFRYVSSAAGLPAGTSIIIALRLGILAASVPLAAEGWLFVCRRRRAAVQVRLWAPFCIATLLALAADIALTRHFARELTHGLIYLSAARAPGAHPAYWNAPGGAVPSPCPS